VWLLWVFAILVAIGICIAVYILYMFRRWHRVFPKPAYNHPQKRPDIDAFPDDAVTVCWIGHSTVYINFFGVRILTDPVFSERVGLSVLRLFTIGVKRHTAPAVSIADLAGKVDFILLSHAHMDHFDLPSLRRLQHPRTQVITAKGTSRLLRGMRFGSVTEMEGRQHKTFAAELDVQAVPVRHWGNRFPWNKGYGFTGYLLESRGVRIFFAGDTAYTPSFQQLRANGPIQLAFMPIGAYEPEAFQSNHCTPEQAWEMFCDTGADWLAPIHWDTFVLSSEPVAEPLERLAAAAASDESRIVIREHGDVFQVVRH
jgi:L-ascorbate metabolism protein UlaG (beta-lactamase superfamily)